MTKYCFFRIMDTAKEVIGCGKFVNLGEAIDIFSKQKQLTIQQFTRLYKVERDGRG